MLWHDKNEKKDLQAITNMRKHIKKIIADDFVPKGLNLVQGETFWSQEHPNTPLNGRFDSS